VTYDPATYWSERGRTYEAEARERGWWDAEDQPLIDLMRQLTFKTVLEVGCGYGRVGAAILRHFPKVKYTGIDISVDLVEAAARRLPDAELICADVATWDSDHTWDLVLAANTLGHIRPEDLPGVWAKMERWATRDIIHIDWNDAGNKTAYQYGHRYDLLHGLAVETPMGATTMFHIPAASR
jgi:trans-aconitate methyltransferase